MNQTLMIVTFRKDFEYLRYCLRSIKKFASGWNDIVIVVPGVDFDLCVDMVRKEVDELPISVRCGDEWPGKGFLWHEMVIMRADEWCSRSGIIFHLDADCVFTEPVTPAEYVTDGKPRLLYESFVSMNKKGIDECNKWQTCVQECLPFDVMYETMRAHPEVYRRELYPRARELVEQKTGLKFDDWMRAGKNDFPQDRCEHNTLGNVALQCFADQYDLYNLEHKPWPHMKIHQGWPHLGMRDCDMEVFKKIGVA